MVTSTQTDMHFLVQSVLGMVCASESHEIFRHVCAGAQLLSGADAAVVLQMRHDVLVETLSVAAELDCSWLVDRLVADITAAAHVAWRSGRRQETSVIVPPAAVLGGRTRSSGAVLVEPLRDEDVVHALLVLVWSGGDARPLSRRRALTPALGIAAGVALSRIDELRLLRSRATFDPLTGLAAGPLFRRVASGVLTRAAQSLRPVSLLVACVEPVRGASRGGPAAREPEVLATVDRWRAVLRPLDLLARCDAEEIVVLLPEVSAAEAQRISSRLVDACPRQVRVLVGGATAASGDDLDALVDTARRALSVRRRSGR